MFVETLEFRVSPLCTLMSLSLLLHDLPTFSYLIANCFLGEGGRDRGGSQWQFGQESHFHTCPALDGRDDGEEMEGRVQDVGWCQDARMRSKSTLHPQYAYIAATFRPQLLALFGAQSVSNIVKSLSLFLNPMNSMKY